MSVLSEHTADIADLEYGRVSWAAWFKSHPNLIRAGRHLRTVVRPDRVIAPAPPRQRQRVPRFPGPIPDICAGMGHRARRPMPATGVMR